MAFRQSEAVAKADLPYVARDLPLTFFGVRHSRWTKAHLINVIETLHGVAEINTTKIDLYETIHHRYNPNKVLQRTINALGVIAQAAARKGQKSQTDVREAVQDAITERADLAREKRDAAKQKGRARPDYGPALSRAKPDPDLKGDEDLYGNKELDNDDDSIPLQRLKRRAPALTRAEIRRGRKPDDDDAEELSDGEVIGVLRRTLPRVNFGDVESGRRGPRKRWMEPEQNTAKRRKIKSEDEVEVAPTGPPAVIFGTSTAIRDDAAFRVGLEPVEQATLAEGPSCQVCSDDLDPLLQFQVNVAAQCNHAPEICLSCWEQHIASQADSKMWDSISCPHADCGAVLGHHDMQRFAPTEVFRRFDNAQTKKALTNAPGYRSCAHEGCGSGGFLENEGTETMICADCERQTCLSCNLICHQGQSCDQYRAWLADAPQQADETEKARVKELQRAESESVQYLQKSAKTCPNARCGAKIQKTDGCDHMTCRVCGQEFCWLCLADFARIRGDGNHRHAPTCPHHFRGIPGHN